MTKKEPELVAGDAYIIDRGTGKQVTHGSACFSSINGALEVSTIKYASLLIEQGKLDQKSPEDVDLFFTEIKKVIDVKFEVVKLENGGIEVVFDLKNRSNKKTNIAFGMIVRSLYSNSRDKFKDLSTHFLNLCKQFPKRDKGVLYTVSCNIFLAGLTRVADNYASGINTNHLISRETGCKVLKAKVIKSLLNEEEGMVNDKFTTTQDDLSSFANKEFCKKKYSEIMKQNGS